MAKIIRCRLLYTKETHIFVSERRYHKNKNKEQEDGAQRNCRMVHWQILIKTKYADIRTTERFKAKTVT